MWITFENVDNFKSYPHFLELEVDKRFLQDIVMRYILTLYILYKMRIRKWNRKGKRDLKF